MRSEIGTMPWARWFLVYLNGAELKHCRMADEEQGCAEVYQIDEKGRRHPEWGTRMVWGKVELIPLSVWGERVKDDPDRAEAIWQEWQREMEIRLQGGMKDARVRL